MRICATYSFWFNQLLDHKGIYKLPESIEHTALKEILGIEKLVDKHLYDALDNLEELNFDIIEKSILDRLLKERIEKKALILDVTDTYFNGSQANWKSRRGKDGKYNKLLQIALAVTKEEGFPIMHKIYEGNISNIKIMQDMLLDIKLKHFDITVVDRGMVCYENLYDLENINQKVVCGLKVNEKLRKDYLDTINREEIYQPSCRVKLKNTTVYVLSFDFLNGKLIAVYNPILEAHKRDIAMESPQNYNAVKAKYSGYSLLYHTTQYPTEDVVRIYFQRDIVEKAYRELKSTINLNPIRKYRLERIRAHVKICYLAYTLLSYIQYRLKSLNLSAVSALEKLQSAYKVEFFSPKDNFKWSKVVTLTNEQKKILTALGVVYKN